MLRTILNAQGIESFEAINGVDALKKLHEERSISVVYLDWNMPEMDGLMCLKQIRANPAYNDIKIVICTTESEQAKVQQALEAGCNGYVFKPFSPDTILQHVTDLQNAAPEGV